MEKRVQKLQSEIQLNSEAKVTSPDQLRFFFLQTTGRQLGDINLLFFLTGRVPLRLFQEGLIEIGSRFVIGTGTIRPNGQVRKAFAVLRNTYSQVGVYRVVIMMPP